MDSKEVSAVTEKIKQESIQLAHDGVEVLGIKDAALDLTKANEVSVPLTNQEVTEHTANLWKYVSINQEEPEPHAEYDTKLLKIEEGEIVAARVRGKKHKHEGTNCDDWFEIGSIHDWALIAVSDGAGSKKYSRIGARESCKSAIAYMSEAFKDIKELKPEICKNISLALTDIKFIEACSALADIIQKAVIQAFQAVESAFEERKRNEAFSKSLGRELSFKDFSGTLLIAVAIPVFVDNKKEHLIISCQIGDGMIASINANESYEKAVKLLGEPDGGGFAGETDFLTSPQMKQIETLMKRTKIGRREITTLMVMSDGVADDYYPNFSQMSRLYLDLLVNGIVGKIEGHKVILTKDNHEILKKVPAPVAYPWVNNSAVKVPIQYINKVLADTGLTDEALWNNKDILNAASLHIKKEALKKEIEIVKEIEIETEIDKELEKEIAMEKDEMLKIWLDNYVERGSFDDRTLVLLNV